MKREEAEKEFDLRRVPPSVTELTIVDFVGFDKRPCRDPHVSNTKEIGHFTILSFEKAGKDRFRFTFKVE
jgi:Ser-tRNA(Ala) deacylase AlaX